MFLSFFLFSNSYSTLSKQTFCEEQDNDLPSHIKLHGQIPVFIFANWTRVLNKSCPKQSYFEMLYGVLCIGSMIFMVWVGYKGLIKYKKMTKLDPKFNPIIVAKLESGNDDKNGKIGGSPLDHNKFIDMAQTEDKSQMSDQEEVLLKTDRTISSENSVDDDSDSLHAVDGLDFLVGENGMRIDQSNGLSMQSEGVRIVYVCLLKYRF